MAKEALFGPGASVDCDLCGILRLYPCAPRHDLQRVHGPATSSAGTNRKDHMNPPNNRARYVTISYYYPNDCTWTINPVEAHVVLIERTAYHERISELEASTQ